MSEWYDKQKQSRSNLHKSSQEKIEKANPRRELTSEEVKRLAKLETIAEKIKRGENVQNRQLQTWLSEDEFVQIEAENGKVTQEEVTRRVLTKNNNKLIFFMNKIQYVVYFT